MESEVRLSISPVTLAQCGECDDGCETCDGQRWELLPVLTLEEFIDLLASDPEDNL